MKLRIGLGVLFLVCSIAAVGADRKYIVKTRPADMKALPFPEFLCVLFASLRLTKRW